MNITTIYLIGIIVTYLAIQAYAIKEYLDYVKNGGNFAYSKMEDLKKGVGVNWAISVFWPVFWVLYLGIVFVEGCSWIVEKVTIVLREKTNKKED